LKKGKERKETKISRTKVVMKFGRNIRSVNVMDYKGTYCGIENNKKKCAETFCTL
jgi:hypothetical protein